jgi:hypothetical protein
VNASAPLARGSQLALLLGSVLLLCACADTGATRPSPPSGERDFSGVWWLDHPVQALQPLGGGPIPLTAQGRRIYQAYQSDLKAGRVVDLTRKYCLPDGLPRLLTASYPFEIVVTAHEVVFLHEARHVYRAVPLDVAPPDPDRMLQNYMGNATGRWEGNVLVIDSVGFNAETRLDATGLPHSEQLHVVERWRRIDGGRRLQDEITIEDPAFYTAAWTTRLRFEYRPDLTIQEYACGEPHRDTARLRGGA